MSFCQVCCYGVRQDTKYCCSERMPRCWETVKIGITDFIYWLGNRFSSFFLGCARCDQWAANFWYFIDLLLLIIGLFGLFVCGVYKGLSCPLYIFIGIIGLSLLPWIIYGIYFLVTKLTTWAKNQYERYKKQYQEYNKLPDPVGDLLGDSDSDLLGDSDSDVVDSDTDLSVNSDSTPLLAAMV